MLAALVAFPPMLRRQPEPLPLAAYPSQAGAAARPRRTHPNGPGRDSSIVNCQRPITAAVIEVPMATKSTTLRPDRPASEPTLWSVRDIVRQGGPKRTRIFQAIKTGELPCHRIGGQRYVRRVDALAWLDGRLVGRAEGRP